MSRRHKLIFVALSLFPFVLAMSFRAVDNYQFALQKERIKKERTDYYPQSIGPTEQNPEHEFSCHEHMLASDSLEYIRGGSTELP